MQTHYIKSSVIVIFILLLVVLHANSYKTRKTPLTEAVVDSIHAFISIDFLYQSNGCNCLCIPTCTNNTNPCKWRDSFACILSIIILVCKNSTKMHAALLERDEIHYTVSYNFVLNNLGTLLTVKGN